MKRGWLIAGVVLLLAAVAIWWFIGTRVSSPSIPHDDTTHNSGDSSAPATETSSVTIQNFSFTPAKVTVRKGTTVTWTNQDSVGHNVVADQSGTGSLPTSNALLQKGQSYSFTFNEIGTFTYHCAPHPSMKGTVEVTD